MFSLNPHELDDFIILVFILLISLLLIIFSFLLILILLSLFIKLLDSSILKLLFISPPGLLGLSFTNISCSLILASNVASIYCC